MKSSNKPKVMVAYYRVSTNKQSLGLAAQKTMVKNFLKKQTLPVCHFTEKESGKTDTNRPELKKALKYCTQNKACLVVATLSRLSRDLHFITTLQKARVDFKVCDMPEASPLTIQIMGAVAQYEREIISQRTSRALKELKARGVPLGSHHPKVYKALQKKWKKARAKKKQQKTLKNKKRANKVKQKQSPPLTQIQCFDLKIKPILKVLKKQGLSLSHIVRQLNTNKIKTRRDKLWHKTTVHRIIKRTGI